MQLLIFLLFYFSLGSSNGHLPASTSLLHVNPSLVTTYWAKPPQLYCVCPVPPPPPQPSTEVEDTLEYTKKVSDAVCLVSSTITEIGEIGLADNPELGASIVRKLEEDVMKAAQSLMDFARQSVNNLAALEYNEVGQGHGRRSKRDAKSDGKSALNKVGSALSESKGKIEGELKGLSEKARKKINKKHKEAIEKCGADSCKAAAKVLQGADDAEDERQ